LFYIGAALSATFIGFGILLFKDISDIRDISPFISHIRLSLNICLAIFFSGYFIFGKYQNQIKYQLALALIMLWLMGFLVISESGTGMYVMLFTLFILVFFGLAKIRNLNQRRLILILVLVIPLILTSYLYYTIKSYLIPDRNDLKNLELYSARGNPYSHDTIGYPVENGSYIGLYICERELRESWNERSTFNYDGTDEKGHKLKATLVRYLNSKKLRKDTEGIERLDDSDIRNIEKGFANVHFTRKVSLNSRIYKVLWEYQSIQRGASPQGKSLAQRFEFWRAATGIIKENFWTGVGTGDMDEAFRNQYEKMKTKLEPEFRFRSHNQFLAIFTAFGVFGFLWFVFTLFYPAFKLKAFNDYNYFVFFTVIILSMFIEDTLESQMGVTLYAFFNAFLLFGRKL
jgi:hypothetical protein